MLSYPINELLGAAWACLGLLGPTRSCSELLGAARGYSRILGFFRSCLRENNGLFSLYSTATQNTWRRGLALGNAPKARILRSPMPTPNSSQWNIGCVGSQRKILTLAMYISCFLCRFHLRLVPNANPIYSGIWALVLVIEGRRLGMCTD